MTREPKAPYLTDEHPADLARSRRRRRCAAVAVTAAVVATAVVGSRGTRPDSSWFRSLDKPSWYPPREVFPVAWTALYASIAWAGTRALSRAPRGDAAAYAGALGTNLALNAAWPWSFFAAERTGSGLATILALDVSNVCLVRRTARIDRAAALALLPYVAWTGFATALTEEIWVRDPR